VLDQLRARRVAVQSKGRIAAALLTFLGALESALGCVSGGQPGPEVLQRICEAAR
jgi:hypothetical protein